MISSSGFMIYMFTYFVLHFRTLLLDDPKKTEHLRALDGATERLHLFKANLLEEGSFDAGVEGCDGVFHTASPFYYAVTDPQVHIYILFLFWF